jgi:BASS family bile acid:Na+ symporter
MLASILSNVFLPLSLAIIMFGMGMTLVVSDFTNVFKYPKAIIIGLINQMVFLPILGLCIAISFDLSAPMAMGLMILVSCPGGPTSNLITQVCKGNIALSVSLTAIISFISVITIPIILSFSLHYFSSGSTLDIKLPVLNTIAQIMLITAIPIIIGMVVRKQKPEFAIKMENPMTTASTIIFILIFFMVIAANLKMLGRAMKEVGHVMLILNLATMSLGYLFARLFKLNQKDSLAIIIESGIQNGTLAFVIAATILKNVEMGIPTGAYSIWMFLTGGVLMLKFGRKNTKRIQDNNYLSTN